MAFKWVVLGKLKPGHHPLWGQYYIRWWLANKAVHVSGHGLFGLNDDTYRLFLRMMGAKVGRGAKIGRHVRIADFDMLDIHENATVDDYAHLRAAEVRRGALRVAPVYVGADAAVCTRAVVGPGGSVPAGATLGPYMSWRELDVHARGVAAQMEEHRKIARMRQPQPSIASLGGVAARGGGGDYRVGAVGVGSCRAHSIPGSLPQHPWRGRGGGQERPRERSDGVVRRESRGVHQEVARGTTPVRRRRD